LVISAQAEIHLHFPNQKQNGFLLSRE